MSKEKCSAPFHPVTDYRQRTLALLIKILIPCVIFAASWLLYLAPYDNWTSLEYLLLAAALAIYFTIILRGRLRDLFLIVTSVFVALASLEGYSVMSQAQPVDHRPRGYSVPRPILGWGPGHPGLFHQIKLTAKTRAVIFDVDYTIDKNLNRAVVSADSGPTVAFFGDSFTFGTGLNDKDTLPQSFADLYDRKVRVLNFGFPGYGPQQFLRALETGMDDPLLGKDTRLFVYETASWQIERSSCVAGYMLRAPRYEMVDGKPLFRGACYQHWQNLPIELLANTALYHSFIEGALGGPSREDVELYIGIFVRAAELARQKYGAPTVILYMPNEPGYLRRSGYTDAKIMQRLRDAGLDVIDATLNREAVGQPLTIPGDGHSTGAANRARAQILKAYIEAKRLNLLAQR